MAVCICNPHPPTEEEIRRAKEYLKPADYSRFPPKAVRSFKRAMRRYAKRADAIAGCGGAGGRPFREAAQIEKLMDEAWFREGVDLFCPRNRIGVSTYGRRIAFLYGLAADAIARLHATAHEARS